MNSRAKILHQVNRNKPIFESKVDLSQFLADENDNLTESFARNLEANDGDCSVLEASNNLQDVLLKKIKGKSFLDLSGIITPQGNLNIHKFKHPKDLASIKTAVFNANLGVAENGAIWLDDDVVRNIRILPFIVEHSIFILNKNQIVPTMHHAYKTLDKLKTGFGTFIAGPSKTGDIEQNLIIGAHGSLSQLVILIDLDVETV